MFKTDEEISALLDKESNLATVLANRPKPRRQITDHSQRIQANDWPASGVQILEPEPEDPDEPAVQTIDSTTIRPLHNGGRRDGDLNIPHKLRVEIALAARSRPLREVAEQYNVSEHHVFELSKGMTHIEKGPNAELVTDINAATAIPHSIALAKLTAVLTNITDEKISRISKVKDLAGIANSLANVARSTAPIENNNGIDAAAKLVVYAPNFKQENHYETIRVEHE